MMYYVRFLLLQPLCASGRALLRSNTCEDQDVHCADWAASGKCETDPGSMHTRCASSCGVCRIPGTPHLESMPIIGWGTCCRKTAKGEPLKQSMREFLRLGGRLIDTAVSYGNHEDIGQVLQESEFGFLKREDIFITSKVPPNKYEQARETVDQMLRQLNTSYIDLVLLHAPAPWNKTIAAWKVLEEAVDKGEVKAIGVSNFDVEQLTFLKEDVARIAPMNNQLDLHPGRPRRAILRYCQAHNISVTAYNSVKGKSQTPGGEQTIKKLAEKYGMTDVQVLLRWGVDHGISVIPGCTSREHIKEALDVAGAERLEDAELTELGGTVVMQPESGSMQELEGIEDRPKGKGKGKDKWKGKGKGKGKFKNKKGKGKWKAKADAYMYRNEL